MDELFVVKRNGCREEVSFDKIIQRIKRLCHLPGRDPLSINAGKLVLQIMDQFCDGISTTEIDQLVAEQCAMTSTEKSAYSELGSRITVSSLHKNTLGNFLEVTAALSGAVGVNGAAAPLLSNAYCDVVARNAASIEAAIDYSRDYDLDYFGMKTLERSYLMQVGGKVIERPQDLWMRVAIGIHMDDWQSVAETYYGLSRKFFTHATPTLFNAGTPRPQLSSCYLLAMEEDSIDGIFDTLKDCALISKWAGGIGLHIHNVRATGTHISGTNGSSNGIVPMLRVFNMAARYVDQGGGKRNGSFACYIEPWHADIESFLDLKKNHGDEESRARDLFYVLWIPDLFMECVKGNKDWYLFCPHKCPGLQDSFGPAFKALYETYVAQGSYSSVLPARTLWRKILESQMETGTPYMLYKDAANSKSNQSNLGTIKSSNLCTEIIEFSSNKETAVCNLASICLPNFVGSSADGAVFKFDELHRVTKVVVRNLNKIIDGNYYPTKKTRLSNLLHRPIGIGVQGLADTFAMLRIAFDSDQARQLNKDIFETIYYSAVEASVELAEEREGKIITLRKLLLDRAGSIREGVLKTMFGRDEVTVSYPLPDELDSGETQDLFKRLRPTWGELSANSHFGAYSSFRGSHAHAGKFQFDLWGASPSDRYNWEALRVRMMAHGMRNSLLLAPMPTASTSQIMGNNECFEPFTSNVYVRRTMAGEFVLVNKHLMRELETLGIWNTTLKNSIIKEGGSIQHIDAIPADIRDRYKTVWETSMRTVIDMAADRGVYVCQSQSMNLWLSDPTYQSMTKMHFHAWEKGLKTGMYYLRRKPVHNPQQFTIAPSEECTSCSA